MAVNNKLVILHTRASADFSKKTIKEFLSHDSYIGDYKEEDFQNILKTKKFADSEMEIEVLSSLRGKEIYLIACSAKRNSLDLSLEENKIELYNTIDAIKRSDVDSITLIEPYCSPSRSDRVIRRNSVGFWVHYKTLVSLGVNHIVTYQLHSDKLKTVVDPNYCFIDDIPSMYLIQEYITKKYIKNLETLYEIQKNWLFCSVDAGGEKLAKDYATSFGTDLIIAHKKRDYSKTNIIESIRILSDTDIKDKDIWVVDDMIDTGGSICALIEELNKREVREVNIAIVHPVFSDPATSRLQDLYKRKLINKIIAVDTIEITEKVKRDMPFLDIVSCTKLTADIITRMNNKKSLSTFFSRFNAERYLKYKENI